MNQNVPSPLLMFVRIRIVPPRAQTYESELVPRLNSNAGFVVAAPLNQTAAYTSVGWDAVYGAGYNFSKHLSIVGEVMWNSLGPNDTALAPQRAEGNYRLTFEGGFTFKLPDFYKFYVESRYHHSPSNGVHTQLVPISIGNPILTTADITRAASCGSVTWLQIGRTLCRQSEHHSPAVTHSLDKFTVINDSSSRGAKPLA